MRNGAMGGVLLGVALGGFFDGILLHQILQWHHLLSAIDPANARFQVAADGWFHAMMYVLGAAGLWLLWGAQASGRGLAGRALAAWMLVGFGAWHIADSVLSHWVLGIHRIRMDSDNRLFWDLVWLAAFGVAPLLLGLLMNRRRRGSGPGGGGTLAASAATMLALGAGGQALRAAPGELTTVLFAPGVEPAQALEAATATGARVAWVDESGRLLVVRLPQDASPFSLYARGALMVTGAGLPPGCFDALRT